MNLSDLDHTQELPDLFQEYKPILESFLPQSVIIEHVGGGSIPGAKTKGDLDIQFRVTPEDFETVCKALQSVARIKYPHMWTNDFALFDATVPDLKVDFVVTVIDGKYDHFSKMRDYLSTHPEAIAEYSALKERYGQISDEEYRVLKSDFFRKIIRGEFNIPS